LRVSTSREWLCVPDPRSTLKYSQDLNKMSSVSFACPDVEGPAEESILGHTGEPLCAAKCVGVSHMDES
jgi:hypothetical protein